MEESSVNATAGKRLFSASEMVSAVRAAARLAPTLTSPFLLPLALGNTKNGEFSLGDEDEANPIVGGLLRGSEGAVQGASVVADNIFLGYWHPFRDDLHMYKRDGAGISQSDIAARIGVGAATAAWGGPELTAIREARAAGSVGGVLAGIIGEGGSAVRAAKAVEAAGGSSLAVWGTALTHLGSRLVSSGVTNVILNRAIRNWVTEGRQDYGWGDATEDFADGVKWAGITNAATGVLSAVSKSIWLKDVLYHYTTEGNAFNVAKPGRSWLSGIPNLLESSGFIRKLKLLAIGGQNRFEPLMEVPAFTNRRPEIDLRLRNTQTHLPDGRIQINFHADPVVIDDRMFDAMTGYGR